ncbi:MAG: hypothetical protein H7Z41_03155 [Cytophagales bacterium]|nr:hypothetical protein [Armatimonadota bacterium]
MTAKSILRFVIGYVIAAVLMGLALPIIGIPRAQLLPPALVYTNARGKGSGIITGKRKEPTSNPFKVGESVYLVEYAFRAKAPDLLGAKGAGTNQRYTGTINVGQEEYARVEPKGIVPIRYEPTYPVISGINLPAFGRSGAQGSGLFSGWMLWLIPAVVLGYCIAPLLERILLRENY